MTETLTQAFMPPTLSSLANRLKVLVVEDHEDAARAMCNLLTRRLGGTVECEFATTLSDGLAKAIKFNADITILDLMLPDKSVQEVIESIPHFPPPVIVVTELDDPDHEIELSCYANEAQNFFRKAQLRSTIVSKEGAALVSAITKAHWRRVLPTDRARRIHEEKDGTTRGN